MRTLFLLAILGALIVIANKRDDQTAMEAVMEMGQKAESLAGEYDKAKTVNRAFEKVDETAKEVSEKVDPFIKKTKEAIAKAGESLPRNEPKTDPAFTDTEATNEEISPKTPNWVMPESTQTAMPDISAMPKASVEKLDLNTEEPVHVANADTPAIDVERTYDKVKGYYENASRLLEEIK